MDVLNIISKELEAWEQTRTAAIDAYNKATYAIEALKLLTDRMREAAENEHQADTLKGVEREVKASRS